MPYTGLTTSDPSSLTKEDHGFPRASPLTSSRKIKCRPAATPHAKTPPSEVRTGLRRPSVRAEHSTPHLSADQPSHDLTGTSSQPPAKPAAATYAATPTAHEIFLPRPYHLVGPRYHRHAPPLARAIIARRALGLIITTAQTTPVSEASSDVTARGGGSERAARERCRGRTGATRTCRRRTRRRTRPRCGSTSTTRRPSATPSPPAASTPPCTPTRSSRTAPTRSSTSSKTSKPTPRDWTTRAARWGRSSWRRSTTRISAASASSTTRPEQASSRWTETRPPRSNCPTTPTKRSAMLLAKGTLLPTSGSRRLTRCTVVVTDRVCSFTI